MWFSNLYFYKLTNTFDIQQEMLEEKLKDFIFKPCSNLETTKSGWVSPLGKHSTLLSHFSDNNVLFCLKREEKVIPASVVKDMLEEKVTEIEAKESRPVKKAEKTNLKEEIIHTLLPRAFPRSSQLFGFVNTEHNFIAINASSASKAEDFMAILRKSLGSLAVVPIVGESTTEAIMTHWLKDDELPKGFSLGHEAELKALDEDGAIVKFKNQELTSEEVHTQIEHGKFVFQLGLNWQENISFALADDMSIKRIKYSDILKEQNDDIPKEEAIAKIDADFALVAGELVNLMQDICEAVKFELN